MKPSDAISRLYENLIPPYIRAIAPYVPGKPIEEVEREIKVRAIKLASNENPLGPSPRAVEAAKKALLSENRYPDGGGFHLRQALSRRLDVPMENLILGCGTTDLIDLAARVLLREGDTGLTSAGSFAIYYISIQAAGAKLVEIPQRDDTIDLDTMARSITPDTRAIYLANPNNPTGTMFTASEFESFLDRVPEHALVVLDEAYFEYVERPDYSRSLDLLRRGRNLFVLRTFSKVYGLAGLRIGYGAGPAALLEQMNKIRYPFNTSGVAQAAALAALDDAEHVRRSIESNRAGLEQLSQGLRQLDIHFVPSVANFLLVEFPYETEELSQELLGRGVIVRPMRWMGFPNGIRVTVGTAEENRKFLLELAEVHTALARQTVKPSKGAR